MPVYSYVRNMPVYSYVRNMPVYSYVRNMPSLSLINIMHDPLQTTGRGWTQESPPPW